MTVTGNRQLLGHTIPFLVGANPNRVAPAHLFNGFLAACLGAGPNATNVIQFIKSDGEPPRHLSNSIRRDRDALRGFAEALAAILNPDRRIFPSATSSSLFPLGASLVSANPADDQLGKQLATLVQMAEPQALETIYRIVTHQRREDVLAHLGTVLDDGYTPTFTSPEDERVRSLVKSTGAFGKAYSKSLASLIINAVDGRYCSFGSQLVAVGRAICLAAYFAALRTPVLLAKQPRKWSDIAPCFISGIRPPGDPRSPSTRLAIRAFSSTIEGVRSALAALIHDALANVRLPRTLPQSQRSRILVKTAFPDLTTTALDEVLEAVHTSKELNNIAKRIADAVYPLDHLSKYYRTVGRMLGIAGPDRGFGSPRLLLETPLLGSLVEGTLFIGQTLSYEEWIDEIYKRFGIILGFGRETDPHELLRGLDRAGPLDRAIRESHEALRLRLITAGLAIEYSDGETQLLNRGRGV